MIDTRGGEVERSAPMSSVEGTRRLGRYQLLRHLATGGMAEIWLAGFDTTREHESGPFRFRCPTHAVIKVIAPERATDRQFVQMFLDEARVAATLHHPNIAQLYEVGFDDQTYYHAMEYVHGENVRAVVERSIVVRKPTPLAATLAIGRAIAAALHYAHERKGATGEPLDIVHRDVTPSNIMIAWDGAVKLVDFGVALAAGRAAQTRTGVVKGKLAYMSPEQCRGVKVDRRTDVFALGVVLYEVSLQRRAFRGDSEYQTMERIVRGDLAPPSKVMPGYPPGLEQIILRAMSTDLDRRYATAAELGAALEQFARGEGVPDGTGAMAAHMRALYGEPPAPGVRPRSSSPVTVELQEITLESDPGDTRATNDTRESPAALAAAAMAPPVSTNVMVPTGPMPVVAGPSPTGVMNAQRPTQFPYGTQPMKPAGMPSETLDGGVVASGAAVASGVAARSGTRAVTAQVAPRSSAPWIIAGAVLLAGVAVAAVILLTGDGGKPVSPPAAAPVAAAETETETETAPETETEPEPETAPAPAPAPASASETVSLTITSRDGPAEVSIDGTRVGTTPYTHRLERGRARHTIEVRRSGFATYRKTITADADHAIDAVLVPRRTPDAPPDAPTGTHPPAGVGGAAASGSARTNDDLSDDRY